MKRIIICLLATTAFISTTYSAIDQNLKYGVKNDSVFELQEYLISKGFLNSSPSGFFGSLTLKAVKDYQTSKGLPSTGYVGVLTRSEINKDIEAEILPSVEAEVQETGTTTPVVTIQTPIITTQNTQQPFFFQPVVSTPPIIRTLSFNCHQAAKTTDGKFVCNISTVLNENGKNKIITTKVVTSYFDNNEPVSVEDTNGGGALFFSKSGEYTITLSAPELGLEVTKNIDIKE